VVSRADIAARSFGQEAPLLLSSTPSLTSYPSRADTRGTATCGCAA
jgi:hypothetical protein